MESDQEIQNAARAIVSFTDSYVQNKQRKQKEQQESQSTLSLAQVTSSVEYLLRQIENHNACQQVIRIPKLLQSLISLVTFKLGIHLNEQIDLLRLKVRRQSRLCLYWIQSFGDEQDQLELVNNQYGRVMSLSFCTAGGVGEEQNAEIFNVLNHFYFFLRSLHEGISYRQPSFQPLPLLVRRTEEQIEEEGANEEIDAQMNNNGYYYCSINYWANNVKAATLNHFIHRG
ncbi:MAG: hypothetical protein EZS28_036867 [Streblomastix strix]|uniref:Uncharacterized protein n=1 Tax=Streblomastix strix TaxID=222440 RepID=A0A5J4U9M9_9EUKA|nr:MAG: hypothetical protein EZS28_036867 [Streblomastix strix]